jgi:hypothetical protein
MIEFLVAVSIFWGLAALLNGKHREKERLELSEVGWYLSFGVKALRGRRMFDYRPLIVSAPPFEGTVDPACLHLFLRVFDLTENDCRALQLDGEYLHLDGGKFALKQVERVTAADSTSARVDREGKVTRQRWAIERMSGGPDLRYGRNESWHETRRTILTFTIGAHQIPHALYERPTNEMFDTHDSQHLARKAVRLCTAARESMLESTMQAYRPLFAELEPMENELRTMVDNRSRIKSALECLQAIEGSQPGLSERDRGNELQLQQELAKVQKAERDLEQRRRKIGTPMMRLGEKLFAELASLEVNAVARAILDS